MHRDLNRRLATTLGILAVMFWSMSVPFSRALTEQLGVLNAACMIYLGGGALGVVILGARRGAWGRFKAISWRYWIGCGGFFIANVVCFHLAVGLASDGQKTIEVGLVNYLWISFTLLLSVPILGKRARWGLLPGMAIACSGVVIAVLQAGPFSWAVFFDDLRTDRLPYALVFSGAVAWAMYSNLTKRWSGEMDGVAVPIFLFVIGLVFLTMRAFSAEAEVVHWSLRVVVELGAMILFPAVLAYLFWDVAMRKGSVVIVVSFSYMTPVMSTALNCLFLRLVPGWGLAIACALVVAGAWICRRSVED